MPWSAAFKRPVPGPGGREFKTLYDVGAYVLALPESERETPAWHTAAENLMQAAEHVAHGDDLCAVARQTQRGDRADIPIALHGGGAFVHFEPEGVRGVQPAQTKKARRSRITPGQLTGRLTA